MYELHILYNAQFFCCFIFSLLNKPNINSLATQTNFLTQLITSTFASQFNIHNLKWLGIEPLPLRVRFPIAATSLSLFSCYFFAAINTPTASPSGFKLIWTDAFTAKLQWNKMNDVLGYNVIITTYVVNN